jgi:hypothetical protein
MTKLLRKRAVFVKPRNITLYGHERREEKGDSTPTTTPGFLKSKYKLKHRREYAAYE